MKYEYNFGGLSNEYTNLQTSKIVILPVPYDGTSTWIKGADNGPQAILEASANMELFDIETKIEVYKQGIFTAEPLYDFSSPEEMSQKVQREVSKYLEQNKFPVVLGGEHSVSIGAIEAIAEKYPDVNILQLDAHADTREEYEESKYNHACVMARARELCSITQVGIRSMDVEEEIKNNQTIFFAHDICRRNDWQDNIVESLKQDVYITIDLDVFDPSIMPSTGTPEPGGLLWYPVLDLLKKVIQTKHVVGLDVVELCPNNTNKAPDFLVAKLIYALLSYRFNQI